MTMIADKLHPQRFPNMSGKMAAIVGCILGKDWTEPTIAELVVTSDGYVLARNSGHIGFDAIIGLATDLQRNWDNLLSSRTHGQGAAGSISSLPAGGQEPLVGEIHVSHLRLRAGPSLTRFPEISFATIASFLI